MGTDSSCGPTDGSFIKEKIIECFLEVHRNDLEKFSGKAMSDLEKKEFVDSLMKKAFLETKGDYDCPRKKDMENVVNWLVDSIPMSKDSEMTKEHRQKIFDMIESMDESHSSNLPKESFERSIRKDCFSQNRFIYKFKYEINGWFVKFLEGYGEVKVFSDFPRPLIKADIPGKFRLVAIMGDHEVDIFFKKEAPQGFMNDFENALEGFLKR